MINNILFIAIVNQKLIIRDSSQDMIAVIHDDLNIEISTIVMYTVASPKRTKYFTVPEFLDYF